MPAEQQADPLRRTHHQPMLAPARAVRAERIEAAQPQVAARHQHALALVEQQVGIGGGDLLQHDRIDALVGQRQRQRAAGIAGIAVAVPVQPHSARSTTRAGTATPTAAAAAIAAPARATPPPVHCRTTGSGSLDGCSAARAWSNSMRLTALPAFADNYIWTLIDDDGAAVVVDPGDAAPVLALADQGLRVDTILLTHHHDDHIGGVPALQARFPGVRVIAPVEERIPTATERVGEGERVQALGRMFHRSFVVQPGLWTSVRRYAVPASGIDAQAGCLARATAALLRS
ncbi:hypothetical protein G6F59_013895 [Rhizopus arrhizus]|nr:hypothetical protein G6F59_013895 [Rhizopus arrhizus]